ncbi:MAG: LPXTG cell wall anchor domain-containing protein [Clostridiales Family XIII bacterium]|nr:LPXTG cell wall anchor domain-containing protein [Clostridiales Family XIII bacterium]
MKHFIKIAIFIVCCATMLHAMPVSAATNSLPPGMLIDDQNGIRVNRDGVYFIEAVDLRPGEIITKTLTIRNTEKAAPPFKLYMTAQPLESVGPVDLRDKVQLKLDLAGRQLYSGRIRGDEDVDMIQNALDLGTYSFGNERTMDITLTVDKDMPMSYEKSAADIRWHFYAVRDESADPPKTGETLQNGLLLLAAALMAGATTFLIIRKDREGVRE